MKNVFWRNGYEGTSYADLIEASGLHKGSLYAAFGDKKSLYLRVLQSYDAQEVAAAVNLLDGAADKAPRKGRERIAVLLNAVIKAVTVQKDRRGCLLCNAAVDQAPFDKDVEKVVSASLLRMQKAIEKALTDYFQGPTLKNKASLMNATYFGMRVLAKSGAPISLMKNVRNGALEAISQEQN